MHLICLVFVLQGHGMGGTSKVVLTSNAHALNTLVHVKSECGLTATTYALITLLCLTNASSLPTRLQQDIQDLSFTDEEMEVQECTS